MMSSSRTWKYGRSEKVIICISNPPRPSSGQKSLHALAELGLFLNLRPMTTAIQHHQLRAGERFMVELTHTQWHDTVLTAPNQKGRQSRYSLQQVGHAGVEHVRRPGDARG